MNFVVESDTSSFWSQIPTTIIMGVGNVYIEFNLSSLCQPFEITLTIRETYSGLEQTLLVIVRPELV